MPEPHHQGKKTKGKVAAREAMPEPHHQGKKTKTKTN
jgi:hypothetical protein